jgi:hypothetical protein
VTPSPAHPPDDGQRPLDSRETLEFERIMEGYRRTARRRRGPPDARRLRWPTVVLVLAAASAFAIASALLPPPANLWAPAGLLVVVAIGSLVWAVPAERSRHPR